MQYSVTNQPLDQLRVLEPEEMEEELGKVDEYTTKINILVNNLLMKQVLAMEDASDQVKQNLTIAIAEIIYGEERIISTRRLSRIMIYLGLLFNLVRGPKQAQYMMGSLFALGGLLKIEARNYLETKRKYDPNFRIVSPLIEDN